MRLSALSYLRTLTLLLGLGLLGSTQPVHAADSKSHYYLAPGVGANILYSNLTEKKAVSYGLSGLVRAGAEKRGFLTLLEGSYGMAKGIGSLTRAHFGIGLLFGLYNTGLEGFYVFGADFSAYNNYRKTTGGNARIGIIKDLSDTMQWTIEARMAFMSSTQPSGLGYGSQGFGVFFGVLFPFRSGPIPADRDAPLVEQKRRSVSF